MNMIMIFMMFAIKRDKVTSNPFDSQSFKTAFETRFERSREKRAAYAKLRDVEPFTRDGERIEVMINAGLRDDMAMLDLTGADGIGLFRTEFQFLVAATMPSRSSA